MPINSDATFDFKELYEAAYPKGTNERHALDALCEGADFNKEGRVHKTVLKTIFPPYSKLGRALRVFIP